MNFESISSYIIAECKRLPFCFPPFLRFFFLLPFYIFWGANKRRGVHPHDILDPPMRKGQKCPRDAAIFRIFLSRSPGLHLSAVTFYAHQTPPDVMSFFASPTKHLSLTGATNPYCRAMEERHINVRELPNFLR